RIRRCSIFVIAVAGCLALFADAAGAAAPPPFPMPLDAGTKYVAQAAEARADLASAQPEITRTQQRQKALQTQYDALAAQVTDLAAKEQAAQAAVDEARARIAEVAAKQYISAGGERVNAALEATLNADDMLSLGRNLHILSKSGTHEVDSFELLDAA